MLLALVAHFRKDALPASTSSLTARAVGAAQPDTVVSAEVHAPPKESASSSVPPHAADEVHVCGVGWFKKQPDGMLGASEIERAAKQSERSAEMIRERLRNDNTERSRAAALVLDLLVTDDERRKSAAADSAVCVDTECPQSPSSIGGSEQARDALARMALSTTDPFVYSEAFKMCGGNEPRSAACGMLNARQWAWLDPGNGTPWLFVLAAAKPGRTSPAEAEALHRIATASSMDNYFFAVSKEVIAVTPDDDASSSRRG